MIDKVQKIREEIEIVINRRLNLLNGDQFDLNKEVDGFTNEITDIIDSLQKEPVSENFEEALAMEWQGYNDRGAATVDALEDNTQELAFAKGFYRGAKWQKEHMMIKAIDGTARPDDGEIWCDLKPFNFKDGDKVKLIVIKKD